MGSASHAAFPRRVVGPFTVGALGLGCMNLSHAYGAPPPEEDAERVLREALDSGIDFFDTAALYGFGANERLVGRVLRPHRHRIVLASKGGMAGEPGEGGMRRVIDGRPQAIARHCDDSLKRLGVDVIDLYYLHRWDRRVPIEESVGAMSRLVEAGKVRALGLSEVSAPTLKRAHAVHPIAAVQSEYSLWSRNPEIAVLQACREIGAAFVAFSPLGRGFLAGGVTDAATLQPQDIRRAMPRFMPDVLPRNLHLLQALQDHATRLGTTAAPLALAWLLAQGEHVLAIPGTTRVDHLRENMTAAGVVLDPAARAALDALMAQGRVAGARYSAGTQAEIDTEMYETE